VINSMAEDIMEKKDGASVRARVWKAGGMRERERERDQNQSIIFRVTRDSPCPAKIWKQ
jgi:Zn-dependent oligopeptidase